LQRQQALVGVAEHARPAELAQAVENLGWLRTALGDVTEANNLVEPLAFEALNEGLERDRIAVHIRDDPDPHRPSAAVSPRRHWAMPLRLASGCG
jgi:hypothetical protein